MVVGLGVALTAAQEPSTVTFYACLKPRSETETHRPMSQIGKRVPRNCPPGARAIQWDVEAPPSLPFGGSIAGALRSRLSIPGVMLVLATGSAGWIASGWRLNGTVRLGWMLVPALLSLAAICVAGPGTLFPKESFEGRSVIVLNGSDAITALDLVGLAIACVAALLATWLLTLRWQQRTS